MSNHADGCHCDDCAKAKLKEIILRAVESGQVTESDVLDAIVKTTVSPEVVALVEDYRLQQGLDE